MSQSVDDLLEAARKAARHLAQEPLTERADRLERIAEALESDREALVMLAIRETYLGEQRLNGELTRTTFQLRLLADAVRQGTFLDVRLDRPAADWPSGPRPDLRRYRVPLGPVEVFAASNFPFAFSVAGGDTASALAAGCPVILKGHPGHPELTSRTAALVETAVDLPGGFGLVTSVGDGVAVLEHPHLAAAAFTGSISGGLALARIAASRSEPIPFFGELGSINPVVVTPRAATERASDIAAGYVGSLTLGAGQFCTNPGLLFVPRGSAVLGEIADRLADVAPAPMLNDRIASGFHSVAGQMAQVPGVTAPVEPSDPLSPRLLTCDLQTFASSPVLHEEAFGPLGVTVTYDDLDDVVREIASLPGQLTTTVQAASDEAAELADLTGALAARSGRVLWNQWPTGVAVSAAQQHGGPFPATTAPGTTSVGTAAIDRFLRPVAYQGWPQSALPAPLQDSNPWGVPQNIDERTTYA
ncbi:aldehyde dehydrogenase (NADP(+)) [Luteipulveratus mongoliensis]|uniref:Aldehyde dehydrogenase n=1 Tax=Luteipulveratus mongoliensis TaxID=571913 RepID=A0A0K1JHT9_9MICO|nr:aldehyde dehydrogenase (NADP(+)) [Luteipulveratus mongoliensis]AKU16274.1 aldehyde dehydrogenase [Luteipulveratus mongoliensis]